MFEVYCSTHRSRVLLSTSRITALRNCPDGVVVEWSCWCGHRGRSLDGRTLGPVPGPAADADAMLGDSGDRVTKGAGAGARADRGGGARATRDASAGAGDVLDRAPSLPAAS